jgi:molecular chaperone DnaJ
VPKNPCKVCKGSGILRNEEEISIKVPAGIENGEMIRMSGMGEAISGGAAGDLYVKIHVARHPTFRKDGNNLFMELGVKLSDALLGADYPIETLDGKITVKIPEGIKFGEMLRVKGKGVPSENGKHRGDLIIKINIEIPHKLSKDARKAIEDLRREGI